MQEISNFKITARWSSAIILVSSVKLSAFEIHFRVKQESVRLRVNGILELPFESVVMDIMLYKTVL